VTTARDRILGSVRHGLLRATLPDASGTGPDLSWVDAAPVPSESGDLATRFKSAVTALTGVVHEAASPDEVARVVAGIARDERATRFVSWDEGELDCPGVLARLAEQGLSRVWYDLSPSPEARARDVLALDPVPLGLTGALGGLADTGGVIVSSGPGRGRLVSLLPPIHIAIVRRDRLFNSLPAYLRSAPGVAAGCSNLVVVAGPSRTADIEMTLSHGVHGPKAVHVILLA
jgi:L-lactate dehydrogenase complex protein LldG